MRLALSGVLVKIHFMVSFKRIHSFIDLMCLQLTLVLLHGKSHGQRSLVGCSPWGCKESDTTEWLHFSLSLYVSWEDALEKDMATHSSILAWEILWTKDPADDSPWGCKKSDMTERLALSFQFMCKVTVLSPWVKAENNRIWTSALLKYSLVHGLENYNG